MTNIYVVQKGDTLYSVSRNFNVPTIKIKRDNQLLDDNLMIGQALVIQSTQEKTTIDVNGYAYPTINKEVLSETLRDLTYLSVFSYHITPTGKIIPIDDQEIINLTKKQKAIAMMVITNIGLTGNFESNLAHTILSDDDIQKELINNILKFMTEKGYSGLDIDFEYLYPTDKDAYNNFLELVANIMHKNSYTVTTALAPKYSENQVGLLYEAHDYSTHGKLSDHVIIMTYEWGYTYGPPMPVAPLDQVEKILNYATSVIPSYKIMMGIPNYGYDWTLPYKNGNKAKSLSNVEAVRLAVQMKVEIQFDNKTKTPFFYYKDKQNFMHVVWFEDARSIQAKLNLIKRYKLGGVSYWTVTNYFSQNWLILNSLYNIRKTL